MKTIPMDETKYSKMVELIEELKVKINTIKKTVNIGSGEL